MLWDSHGCEGLQLTAAPWSFYSTDVSQYFGLHYFGPICVGLSIGLVSSTRLERRLLEKYQYLCASAYLARLGRQHCPNTRLFRSFVLDEVDQDYVRTARAKGLSEPRVMFVHVLRNALIPVITFVISNLPGLLLGAFCWKDSLASQV